MMLKRLFYALPITLITGALVRLATVGFIDFSSFNWSKPRPDLLMEYGVIARNLADGLGYSYTWYTSSGLPMTLPSAYMPPGLVFLEYGIIEIFGYTIAAALAIFIIHLLMGVASIWLIGKITDRMFSDHRISGVARWIVALYPPFIYTAMSFGITTLVMFVSLGVLHNALALADKIQRGDPTLRSMILLGASCGLLMLTRGEGPLIVLATFVVLAIKLHSIEAYRFRQLLAPIVIAFILIAPWTIRNYLVFDEFIPVSSNGSFNFWRGNNGITSGSPLNETGDPLWSTDDLWKKTEPALATGVDFENSLSSAYQDAALQWIRNNPDDAVLLAFRKAVIFWTFDVRNTLSGWAYIVFHTLALGAVIFGTGRLIRRPKRLNKLSNLGVSLMATWAVLATIIAMIFIPLVRFQIVTMAMLVPIAAYGIDAVFARSTSR